MQYKVHIYATVRVPVTIEAESQTDAIKQACEATDLGELLSCDHYEYAEEITSFLVDEIGDEDYKYSRNYRADGLTQY